MNVCVKDNSIRESEIEREREKKKLSVREIHRQYIEKDKYRHREKERD